MPNRNNQDQEPKRQFMREKIAKPPMTRRQFALRLCSYALIAAVGGLAAGASFAVVRPLAEKYLASEEAVESTPVTIPKDEPETAPVETAPVETTPAETLPPETVPVETLPSEASSEPSETESVKDVVQSLIERYEHDEDDLLSMYASMRHTAIEADSGIVVVHSVKREVDLFDNPVETSGLYAGAVIAASMRDLFILTSIDAVDDADSIKVTFVDNSQATGTIRQTDAVAGVAVVSVDKFSLSESTRNRVKALELGNSYNVKQGDVLMALGSPAGYAHSSTYGTVSYVLRNVQVPDGVTRLLFADIVGDADKGTFLLNLSGQLVGWITDRYEDEIDTELNVAMAISDYKGILEKLSNGIAVPYVGIKGQEVTGAMAEGGLPLGVYVAQCVPDSPAYFAGIQPGDVITKVGEKSISTIKDYQNAIDSLNKDDEITIVVQRKSIEEYKELEYQVIVRAR